MGIENLDLEKKLQSSFLHSSEQPYTTLKICARRLMFQTKSFYLLILYFATGQRNVEGVSSK